MNKFSIKSLTKSQKLLRKRILEISYKNSFSHIGSCFCSVDVIDAIYKVKRKSDEFVLSNGHAGVALYAVLEKYGYIKNKKISEKLSVHPDRNTKIGISVSTGSLGQGLPIAIGMAIANPKRKIYCTISDGECNEGSIWEALRIINEKKILNIHVIIIANGWGAYDRINIEYLEKRIRSFGFFVKTVDAHNIKKMTSMLQKRNYRKQIIFAKAIVEQLSFLKGQDAHYYIMKEIDYKKALRIYHE